MFAFLLFGQFEGFDPAPAVAADIVSPLCDRSRCSGIAFQGESTGVDRDRNLPLVEQSCKPPEANAAAVLVGRFGSKVALARRKLNKRTFDAGFGLSVTIGD